MTVLVKFLGDLTAADVPYVGTKAATLARLKQCGWPTPDGFCITTQGYERFVQQNGLAEFLDVAKAIDAGESRFDKFCSEAQALVESAKIPESVADAIEAACEKLAVPDGCRGESLAVRSSATVEDLSGGSFAGLFETFLNVDRDDVLHYVKRCWASLWNVAALMWLSRCKDATGNYAMGVMIQPMVRADCAGVMFTANPVSGSPFQLVINSARGLGEGVVSGSAECDRFVVNETDLSVVESTIAAEIEQKNGSRAGISSIKPATLTEPQIKTLAKMGLELQTLLGKPQDIEWALAAGKIYLLQSRPIVKLPPYFPLQRKRPEEYAFKKWKLEFPELFSQFGRSVEELKNDVYGRARSDVLGVTFTNHRSIFNGYIYHRPVEKRPSLVPWLVFKGWQYSRWLVLARTADRKFQEEVIPCFLGQVAKIRRSRPTSAGLDALVERVGAAVDCYLSLQRETVLVNVLAMSFSGLVLRFARYLGAASGDHEVGGLLKGVPNKTSERDELLSHLVLAFHANGLAESLAGACNWHEVAWRLEKSQSGKTFLEQFENFEREFGYVWADGNVKDAGWRRNDDFIMSVFRNGVKPVGFSGFNGREENPEAVEGSRLSLRGALLDSLVRLARRYSPYREDHNHYLSSAVMLIRETALDCGEEAVRLGLLEEACEIFHLTHAELQSLPSMDGNQIEALRPVIRERSRDAERQKRFTPPSSIDLRREERPAVALSGETRLSGTPGSPGVVSGPARVLKKCDLDQIRTGDILICHNFRPDWSPLFRYIKGLVTNQGYGLTHGANLAREWGIPAVMGVREATVLIADGDVVQVDGDNGIVYVQPTRCSVT